VVAGRRAGDAVAALARELAQGPTKAFGGAKRLFHQSTWESLETQMELGGAGDRRERHTEDFRSGVGAFAREADPDVPRNAETAAVGRVQSVARAKRRRTHEPSERRPCSGTRPRYFYRPG
jgi:hypothetical protein